MKRHPFIPSPLRERDTFFLPLRGSPIYAPVPALRGGDFFSLFSLLLPTSTAFGVVGSKKIPSCSIRGSESIPRLIMNYAMWCRHNTARISIIIYFLTYINTLYARQAKQGSTGGLITALCFCTYLCGVIMASLFIIQSHRASISTFSLSHSKKKSILFRVLYLFKQTLSLAKCNLPLSPQPPTLLSLHAPPPIPSHSHTHLLTSHRTPSHSQPTNSHTLPHIVTPHTHTPVLSHHSPSHTLPFTNT